MCYYFAAFSQFLSKCLFRVYHYLILPLRYKITTKGLQSFEKFKTSPKEGILFLSNHPSHLDASFVGLVLLKVNYLLNIWTMDFVFKNFYTRFVSRNRHTTLLLKVPNVHENRSPKNPIKVRRLIRRTVEGLHEGENILFFPAGYQKFTPHEEISGKSAVERILRQHPNVNIVLVKITGLWGSRFSKAVCKSERSDLRAGQWMQFIWKIIKMILLNLIFFIPKRYISVEFLPVGEDFPRKGSRAEINQYIEDFYNRGFGNAGEPLQRVSDYFWKEKYPAAEYHLKDHRFDLKQVPEAVQRDVIECLVRMTGRKYDEITPKVLLDRDLCLDSLEITEVLVELEGKYQKMEKVPPKTITTVGHLMALAAGIPIEYVPILGEFPVVHIEPPFAIKAWHACTGLIAGIFGFLDTQR